MVQYIGTVMKSYLQVSLLLELQKIMSFQAPFWLFQFLSLPFAVVNICHITGRVLTAHIHPPRG